MVTPCCPVMSKPLPRTTKDTRDRCRCVIRAGSLFDDPIAADPPRAPHPSLVNEGSNSMAALPLPAMLRPCSCPEPAVTSFALVLLIVPHALPDLLPTPAAARTWGAAEFAALWVTLVISITTYYLAASLVDLGEACFAAVVHIVCAGDGTH